MASPTRDDAKRSQELYEALSQPFSTRKLAPRILLYNREKTQALVCPTLSKSVVIERLNEVCGVTGWRVHFLTQTLSNITRRVSPDKEIITGKILITCQITIDGLGVQESTGEMWADDNNASTSAEAQSLKRAASRFGVGLYLESVPKVWLPVDGQKRLPSDVVLPLPDFAIPPDEREEYKRRLADFKQRLKGGNDASTNHHQTNNPASGERNKGKQNSGQAGPHRRESNQPAAERAYLPFRNALGEPLTSYIVEQAQRQPEVKGKTPEEVRNYTVDVLSRASSMMYRVRSLTQDLHESEFYRILDECKVETLKNIPNLDTLRTLEKKFSAVRERYSQGRAEARAA
jgi:hypothetical protein